MTQGYDDEYRLRRHRQFVLELEREIGQLNRSIVHERMPHLNRERCLQLAAAVARARASYLEAALGLSESHSNGEAIADQSIESLALARRHFEELREAFTAMERAIECGYVDVELPG